MFQSESRLSQRMFSRGEWSIGHSKIKAIVQCASPDHAVPH